MGSTLSEEFFQKRENDPKNTPKIISVSKKSKKIVELENMNLKQESYVLLISFLEKNIVESLLLSENFITKIEGLTDFKSLTDLDLLSNKIERIEGIENCINLKRLSLANNNIQKIEGLSKNVELVELSLSLNKIKKIEGLEKLTKLKKLCLNKNLIQKVEGLDNLKELNRLELYNNLIIEIEESLLEKLSKMKVFWDENVKKMLNERIAKKKKSPEQGVKRLRLKYETNLAFESNKDKDKKCGNIVCSSSLNPVSSIPVFRKKENKKQNSSNFVKIQSIEKEGKKSEKQEEKFSLLVKAPQTCSDLSMEEQDKLKNDVIEETKNISGFEYLKKIVQPHMNEISDKKIPQLVGLPNYAFEQVKKVVHCGLNESKRGERKEQPKNFKNALLINFNNTRIRIPHFLLCEVICGCMKNPDVNVIKEALSTIFVELKKKIVVVYNRVEFSTTFSTIEELDERIFNECHVPNRERYKVEYSKDNKSFGSQKDDLILVQRIYVRFSVIKLKVLVKNHENLILNFENIGCCEILSSLILNKCGIDKKRFHIEFKNNEMFFEILNGGVSTVKLPLDEIIVQIQVH